MSSQGTAEVAFQFGVRIPVRDGVELSAALYLPESQGEPRPCVVTLTPYVADNYHERGMYFASHGLPFVIVDVRGRGNSLGKFRPLIQEAHDGHDVVEWLARRPFCNGKVAMWGGSYGGYVQWATAKELPAHLATIVPAAAPYPGIDFPMRNNIAQPYIVQWLTYVSGHASQLKLFKDNAFWSAVFARWYRSGRAFRDLDSFVGNRSATFQEWLGHPEPDAYWDSHNLNDEQYARLDMPILTITGSYDDDQPGALEHYVHHMRLASAEARARHYLIIGPWDHAGTRTPSAELGGLRLGEESLVDLLRLHLEWYAWTLQGGPKPEFLRAPVAYYVMGTERWRYAQTLEAVTHRHARYFLDSVAGAANDLNRSGYLQDSIGSGAPDSYTYDPGDVEGPEVAAEARSSADSLVDQRVLHALCGRMLVYHSAALSNDIEINGFFRLSVWIAIDCPDTDLYVSVHEVCPDGTSIRLATDAIRARYRQGLRSPRLIGTREPLRYDFERFTFVSRRVTKGSRLRLVIAPIGRLIESTFTQKNYNAGGCITEECAEDARIVTVRLFHDAQHPGALEVPLGRRDDEAAR